MTSHPRPLQVIVPFYRNAAIAGTLLHSVEQVGGEWAGCGCSLLAINDSPDDAELSATLRKTAARLSGHLPVEIVENAANAGFVGSANTGLARAVERGCDALLLNSDTVIFPGAVAEMRRVSALDPMIGFVSPRSNNATLCSLPHQAEFRSAPPEQAFRAFEALAPRLPAFHFVPTAVGFCLLIKLEILEEFGLLDPSYGHGYNEENDLIMRANRCGYRAALANHAFVYHVGEASFATSALSKAELEQKNAEELSRRYPEYLPAIARYYAGAHYEAERLMASLLPDGEGRRDIAFDFSAFTATYNGTFEAARQILRRAAAGWRDFRIHVLISGRAARFHGLDRIPGIILADPRAEGRFALAFRFGQPFDFESAARMSRSAAVNVYAMLDPIAFDCLYLNQVDLELLWGAVFEHADCVTYISEFAAGQFHRRFRRHARLREEVMPLSLDLDDYAPQGSPSPGDYILVIGNDFAHKHVKPTVEAISRALPDRRIVALGLRQDLALPQVTSHPSGNLSPGQVQSLFRGACAVVVPSHYEGFGLPVLEALAAQKPVLARDIPVFREIRERLGTGANMLLYGSTHELLCRLAAGPVWRPGGLRNHNPGESWDALVQKLGGLFRELLASVSFAEVLVPRLHYFHLLEPLAGPAPAPSEEPAEMRAVPGQIHSALQTITRLSALVEDREAKLADMRRSLSWRMTAPLRLAGGVLLKLMRR